MISRRRQLTPTSPMLSQALRTRTRQHTSTFRLHLHQHFNHTLTSTSEEEDTPTPDDYESSRRKTAFIQTWDPFHNLADAFALLRAVERKFGKVEEAQFFKDFEMNNKYQLHTFVSFSDHKSRTRIPLSGCTFLIPAPVIEDRPGGPGLDDIRHLLDSADRDESFEFAVASEANSMRVIGAHITRSERSFYTFPKFPATAPNKPLARDFLKWGGFYKLEPMEVPKNIDILPSTWFDKPGQEQGRMRAALEWCSRRSGLPNPAEIPKLKAYKSKTKVSDSSPAFASMDSPESNSPTTPDIPISHESTSKSAQSRSLLPQPPSQSPPEPTQLPPEPAPPEPTIPRPGQLTPEQKTAMQKQMSKAKQLMAKTKQPAAKKKKPKKEAAQKTQDQMLDKSPEQPLQPQSKSIVASFWKFLGR